MVLEASMIIIDNSEWMRNGDYTPTRLRAQNDAVNLVFSSKTQANPENAVGLMTMAGRNPEVLVTLTPDYGKILAGLHGVKISGQANFLSGVQIASLVLKHRQNRNQRQRIIVFVGSPINADEKTLIKLAKKMKKNNVAVDIINFGEDTNSTLLQTFIDNVNNDNSHLVTIPPGPNILSDTLLTTPIIAGEDGIPRGFGHGGDDFDVDPTLDPELALALRISLEEDKARQEAAAKQNAEKKAAEGSGNAAESESMNIDAHDSELQAALALSMGGRHADDDVEMDDSEDQELQMALAMSLQDNDNNNSNAADEEMMSAVLDSLPGVDPNDERIRKALGDKKDKKNNDKK